MSLSTFFSNSCSNFLLTLLFGMDLLGTPRGLALAFQSNECYGANCPLHCADFLLTRMEL